MSLEIIQEQIQKFFKSSTPEVMAIVGKWGVGKTYTWDNLLSEAKESGEIGFEKYSYVSLFGINSLEAFKFAVFENLIKTEMIGKKETPIDFNQDTLNFVKAKWKKGISLLTDLPFVRNQIPANFESMLFSSISSALICIDDLDRKGTGLNIEDVLGLVTVMKGKKDCKVVLIFNDEEEALKEYKKHKEKIIDLELRFIITPEEAANYAINKDGYEFKTAKELSQNLKIVNIRALKKIEHFIKLIIPFLKGYEEETKYAVIHSLTLFTWCYYCSNDRAPSFDFITSLTFQNYLGIGGNEERNEKEEKWMVTLRNYEYTNFDSLDRVLAEFVRSGFIIEKDFNQEVKTKNDGILNNKGIQSYIDAWSVYHNSFKDNQEEVIGTLFQSCKDNISLISRANLNETVRIFRELGEDKKASEMIEFFVEANKKNIDIFNLEIEQYNEAEMDDEIIEKFNTLYKSSVTQETASEILARISGANSWSPDDVAILANTSVEEYYQLFKSESGKQLPIYVNKCLEFGNYDEKNDKQKEISKRTKEALNKIGSECKINKLRVRKFGIRIID